MIFFLYIFQADDEEAAEPVREKVAFTVKITKFDSTKKIALIKEIKNLMEGLNLVQVYGLSLD